MENRPSFFFIVQAGISDRLGAYLPNNLLSA
jgi:hypothetical protein